MAHHGLDRRGCTRLPSLGKPKLTARGAALRQRFRVLDFFALVYPDRPAVVAAGPAAEPPRTWRETRARCLRLAAALGGLGVARHDVVAVFAQNIPAFCELHFGIPMAGAVICALNSRLDAGMASVLLQHSEVKVLFVDAALLDTAREALRLISKAGARSPTVVLIKEVLDEPAAPADHHHQYHEYEALLASAGGSPEFAIRWPADENEAIALNNTSGTTSRPKGVVYSHRGAYLNTTLASVLLNDMAAMPEYLWTVPMFHCNGWCLVWGVAAQGGTNVCLRKVSSAGIFDAVARHGVTHMGGPPTVLSMVVNATAEERRSLPRGRSVTVMTGGAPPPPQVLFRMEELGFLVIHSYGLTETYGPATVCTWKPEWDALPAAERAAIKSRQGLHHLGLEVDVKDPATMRSVPADGRTMGEVRGQHGDERLLQGRRGDGRGDGRRVDAVGRPGGAARRRVREDPGPVQGHHHLRRGEHQHHRGGGGGGGAARRVLGRIQQ